MTPENEHSSMVGPIRVASLFFALTLSVLILIILHTQQFLFGDGAFFAFTATLKHPWSANWCDYPARLGVFFWTIVPTNALYHLGLPFRAIPDVYAAIFLVQPLLWIGLTFLFLPMDKRQWISVAVLFWASIGMCTFAFPTETFITAAAFWPSLFGALYPHPSRRSHLVVRTISTFVFFFSHEAALLAAPLIVLAVLWDGRTIRKLSRIPTSERLYLAILVSMALGAIYNTLLFHPANPLVTQSMQKNRPIALDLIIFHRYPMLKAGTIVILACIPTFFIRRERHAMLFLVPATAAVSYLFEKVLTHHELAPQRLYLARTGILYMLPLFGFVVIIAARRQGRLHPLFLSTIIVLLMAAQGVNHLALNADWRTYRDRFVMELTMPKAETLVDYTSTTLPQLIERTPRLRGFIWPWVMPYQSIFLRLPDDSKRTRMLFSATSRYVHITCETAREIQLSPPPGLSRDLVSEFSEHICKYAPNNTSERLN